MKGIRATLLGEIGLRYLALSFPPEDVSMRRREPAEAVGEVEINGVRHKVISRKNTIANVRFVESP